MTMRKDEWAILAVLDAADRHLGMFDATTVLNPEPAERSQRQIWQVRQVELIGVFLDLCERGFVHEVVPADSHTGDLYVLSQQGRALLRP